MKKNIWITLIIVLFSMGVLQAVENDYKDFTSWQWLKKLLVLPGVSGVETQVADFIQKACPLDVQVQRDDMHNVWFTVGKGKPHLLFVAHTDELGFIVDNITDDGMLKVKGRGGFFPQMYEGRIVVIYTEIGQVEGIVAPRKGYYSRNVPEGSFTSDNINIYIGVDNKQDVIKTGVSVGDQVIVKKHIVELSKDIIAARAVDDRAGCAALLNAMSRIDWNNISGKTITFAWDVQEEVGLLGASRLAKTLDVDYVFPIDTFVSSDGPLDSKRFAMLPQGQGAVLRAVDSSSITPRADLEKIIKIARRHKIPFQLGNTRGGNDGSVFIPEGGVNIPLSWPGTYSHSFIEKIYKSDLEALTDLIVAIVKDF